MGCGYACLLYFFLQGKREGCSGDKEEEGKIMS